MVDEMSDFNYYIRTYNIHKYGKKYKNKGNDLYYIKHC